MITKTFITQTKIYICNHFNLWTGYEHDMNCGSKWKKFKAEINNRTSIEL